MSSISPSQVSSRSRLLRDELSLLNWPLRDDGWLGWAIAAAQTAAAVLVGLLTDSFVLGALAFTALVVSSWRLWIPVQFQLGPRGIQQRVLRRQRRIGWYLIDGYQVTRRGILLLPTGTPGPAAPLRSVFIAWNGKREELLAIVERYVGSASGQQPPIAP